MVACCRVRVVVFVLLASIALPQIGHSLLGLGDVVFDPSNYANTLLIQINTLKSTVNEGIMIANQAKSLEYQVTSLLNEAKNLKANPLRLLGQVEGLWNAYNMIMANAEGIAFGLDGAQQRFEATYPVLASPNLQTITAQSAAMLKSIRGASKTAIGVQSVYTRLCDQLENTRKAMTAAQASEGALQIAQAQAQIQALGTEQLATIAQIEAANGRVQTEWIALQAKEREDAAQVNARFMDNIAPQGFKPLGQP